MSEASDRDIRDMSDEMSDKQDDKDTDFNVDDYCHEIDSDDSFTELPENNVNVCSNVLYMYSKLAII